MVLIQGVRAQLGFDCGCVYATGGVFSRYTHADNTKRCRQALLGIDPAEQKIFKRRIKPSPVQPNDSLARVKRLILVLANLPASGGTLIAGDGSLKIHSLHYMFT